MRVMQQGCHRELEFHCHHFKFHVSDNSVVAMLASWLTLVGLWGDILTYTGFKGNLSSFLGHLSLIGFSPAVINSRRPGNETRKTLKVDFNPSSSSTHTHTYVYVRTHIHMHSYPQNTHCVYTYMCICLYLLYTYCLYTYLL